MSSGVSAEDFMMGRRRNLGDTFSHSDCTFPLLALPSGLRHAGLRGGLAHPAPMFVVQSGPLGPCWSPSWQRALPKDPRPHRPRNGVTWPGARERQVGVKVPVACLPRSLWSLQPGERSVCFPWGPVHPGAEVRHRAGSLLPETLPPGLEFPPKGWS